MTTKRTLKKKYSIKITPELKAKLKQWWAVYRLIEDDYWEQINETEKKMAKDTKIKDIEFFHSEGSCVGIGNTLRTMELIQKDELEAK